MENIPSALARINRDIREAESKYGRTPGSVTLLAVSKQRPVADILAAQTYGQLQFAENYVQEALAKIKQINDPGLTWHFIGPIQSNKTRLIAEHFHWVHSLDRVKTARRLHEARPAHLPPLNVCIQINISGEHSKAGIAPAELQEFVEQCTRLPNLRIRGLMALPEPLKDFLQQRSSFRRTRLLFEDLCRVCAGCDTLSMGTTQDMQAAIAEGSTMVRIGTAVFGSRD